MSGETQLLLVIAGVHILGLACVAILMLPALRDDGDPPFGDSGSDDGWGNHPRRPRSPRNVPGGGLPLPDARPARIRLRGHERLRDLRPTPDRRPAREPSPRRRPVRTGSGSPRRS